MKRTAVVAFLSCLLCAPIVLAGETAKSSDKTPPPAPVCSVESCCKPAPKPVVIYKGPTPFSRLKDKVDDLAKRLNGLDSRVCVKPCAVNQADQIAELKSGLADLTNAVIMILKTDADGIEVETLQEARLKLLEDEINRLANRLDQLERQPSKPSVRLGPQLGAIGIWSRGHPAYLGLLVGPRLALHLNDDVFLAVDLDLAAGLGESPIGMKIRGGVGVRLTDHLNLELGVDSLWVDYDRTLRATSASYLADVGLLIGGPRLFVSGHGLIGLETAARGTSFAGGAMIKMGLMFP